MSPTVWQGSMLRALSTCAVVVLLCAPAGPLLGTGVGAGLIGAGALTAAGLRALSTPRRRSPKPPRPTGGHHRPPSALDPEGWTDEQLRHVWRFTCQAVRKAHSPVEGARWAQVRSRCLDEMARRSPELFAQWLATGASPTDWPPTSAATRSPVREE